MSIRVMTEVWGCAFEASEQSVMLVLADFADDDGANCYPSLGRVAWRTGFNVRTVRRIVSGLRDRGVLVALGPTSAVADKRYAPTEYRLDLSGVTRKAPYDPRAYSDEGGSRGDRGRIEVGQDVRPDAIEGGSRGGTLSGLGQNEGGSRGDRMSGLGGGSNLRGDRVSGLRADPGGIVGSADPSVTTTTASISPDPVIAAAAGGGAGEPSPWLALEPVRRELFFEIARGCNERRFYDSPDAIENVLQLLDEAAPEDVREGIRACRRDNVQPWPRQLRERTFVPEAAPVSLEERRQRPLVPSSLSKASPTGELWSDAWADVLGVLQRELSSSAYETWCAQTRVLGSASGTVFVDGGQTFECDQLNGMLQVVIRRAVVRVVGAEMDVVFVPSAGQGVA